MDDADWVPPEVDTSVPSIARVYDYYLGGSHNFRADRDAARHTLAAFPDIRLVMYEFRGFLRRSVRFLVESGVTQFLDLGSGIPTVGNVHEVAQSACPDARVVYVDKDPIAVAHSRSLLAENEAVGVVHADIREPDRVLGDPAVRRLLDLSRPVGLLVLAILHFVPDGDEPAATVRRYRDALAPGSYLAISHGTLDDHASGDRLTALKAEYDTRVARTAQRPKAAIQAFFDGFEMVEPGLVPVSRWRPEPEEQPSDLLAAYGGVGRKR